MFKKTGATTMISTQASDFSAPVAGPPAAKLSNHLLAVKLSSFSRGLNGDVGRPGNREMKAR